MEGTSSSEMSVLTRTIQRNISEDGILQAQWLLHLSPAISLFICLVLSIFHFSAEESTLCRYSPCWCIGKQEYRSYSFVAHIAICCLLRILYSDFVQSILTNRHILFKFIAIFSCIISCKLVYDASIVHGNSLFFCSDNLYSDPETLLLAWTVSTNCELIIRH
jgi:hypothetical protein